MKKLSYYHTDKPQLTHHLSHLSDFDKGCAEDARLVRTRGINTAQTYTLAQYPGAAMRGKNLSIYYKAKGQYAYLLDFWASVGAQV